jgi:hypothetical protein
VNGADIELQVGAAQGLWTHTPVDYAGNEGYTKAAGWPANAAQGDLGIGTGTRPGGAATQSGPADGIVISEVDVTNLTATGAGIMVKFSSAPTSCRVNYGTTQAVSSTAAGTATTSQTIALSGLTSGTTYYYSVQATNAQGTTVTGLYQFKTF